MNFFYDLLFPKRCVGCKKLGSYICSNCFSYLEVFQDFVCPMCLKRSIIGETHPSCKTQYGLDGFASAVVYKGVAKQLIYRFKFPPYLSDLGEVLGKILIEGLSQNELFMSTLPSRPIVIPVPLSSLKLKKRGYNQSEILSQTLAKKFKIKHFSQILARIENIKQQNKSESQENVKNAFHIKTGYKNVIKNKTLFLVDDFSVSCKTLKECAKILKQNGAKRVYGVTFAHKL